MKPTSALSLLFFLQLASTAPIPEKFSVVDCHSATCSGLRSALISSKPNTPRTRLLTNPHFPSHQLSPQDDADEEIFDNHPITPLRGTRPSVALTSDRPLSSAFLLSLNNPASIPAIQKAPHPTQVRSGFSSKPTSALANLRKEDAKRYWASLRPASSSKQGDTLGADGPRHKVQDCGAKAFMSGHYITFQGVRVARDYSDLMVVGIVVLFLVAVVALELLERIGDVSTIFGARRGGRRGEIYLEDDDSAAKGPISLQAGPLHYQISTSTHDDEKEASTYASNA